MTVYTKNKIVLAYAEVRYSVGTRVADFMGDHNLRKGIWKPLWIWAVGSEGRYNCLIEPELGARIKKSERREWLMYLTQYKGKGSFVGLYVWSVPFVHFFYSRIPTLYNYYNRQNRMAYWTDEQNVEYAKRYSAAWPGHGSWEERVAEAAIKHNYWKERK